MREQSKHRGVKLFFMLFLAIMCFSMISADAAYPTLSSRYGVILSNASSKKKTIYVDLTGSVNVSTNPSVRYYSTVDIGGKLYNSIAPAKGTKMTWLGDIPGIDYGYKTYTSQGGSVSGGWQNNKKSAINLNSVDATASTPYIRLPKVSRAGYTFTGWTVSETQTPYVYYNYKYRKASSLNPTYNPGVQKGSDGFYYIEVGAYSTIKTVKPTWKANNYYLDVNGLLDGTATGNTAGYGTFDVYINGNLVANDVTDFYQSYAYGTKYEIRDIKAVTGKTYNGVSSGSISGTIGTSNSIQLKFTTIQYSNSISHWMFGFTKGEGNNSGKNAWLIGNTSFTSTYNSSYKMDSSRAKRIPNGFQLASTFGTSSISGSWQSYPLGTTVTQKADGMSYEYDYSPITYQINYDMQGGTNSSTNPTTYNVLYGVTLQNPTRRGFTFDGWLLNGKKVTGINPGANAVFTGESDMYNKLASRTTGNVTLTAKWINHTPEFKPEIDGTNPDNNPIPPFFNEEGMLVIQKDDVFTPINYISVDDVEDGKSIEDDIQIDNGVPLNDENEAYKPGPYDVTYTVTDIGGATGTYTLKVIVNEPPVINATDRTFFKGQKGIDKAELLRKVTATDKESGSLTNQVKIVSIDYKNGHVDKNVTTLDTSNTGIFTITYTVTDGYKKTVTKTATIRVIDNQSIVNSGKTGSIRFINGNYLNTLNEQSVWKNSEYYSILNESLNKDTAETYSQAKIREYRGN